MDHTTCFSILLLLTASAPAVAVGEIPAKFRTPYTAKDYPDADVLALEDIRVYTLHPDGRVDRHVGRVEKVLTYHGMDEIGDPHVPFDSARQTIRVIRSLTWTPEGEEKKTQDNGFNVMTPFALAKAPDYTEIHQLVITHVGLDIGAVVQTDYVVSDEVPWRTHLEGVEVLQDDESALLRRIIVEVPAGTTLLYHVANGEARLEISHTGDLDVYTWTLENVGVARKALAEPEAMVFLPTLLFTTAPDWKTWSNTLADRLDTALEDPDGNVARLADRLLEGRSDTLARVEALHGFVVDAVLTASWPLTDFDYAMRPAARTLESSHGHTLDKAVLLTALLRDAGYTADITIVDPNPLEDPALRALPCLARLTQPLVRVDADGETLWLDPTAKLETRSQRDFAGWEGLPVVAGTDALHLLEPPDVPNRLTIRLDATLDADNGIQGDGEIILLGHYAPFFEVRGDKTKLESFTKGLVSSVVATVDRVEASVVALDPFQVRLRVSFSAETPSPAPRVVTVETGIPSGSLLETSPFMHLASRTLPLILPATGEEMVTVTWTLPKGKVPRFIPAPVATEGEPGRAARTWRLEDGKITMTSETIVRRRVVAPPDYPAFKAMHDLLAADSSRTVIF